MSFLSNLNWRNATKAFDSEKKITDSDLQIVLNSIRLSPSSFGLQPYHIHIVSDPIIKKELRKHSWDQPQVTDCSHLLVFSSRTDVVASRIDALMKLMTNGDTQAREKLSMYENVMRNFLSEKSPDQLKSWADRQTYIALGFAMASCSEQNIDSCPIEGFLPQEADKTLELPPHLKSVVMLTLGYRKENPKREKVRFEEDELFTKK